MNGRARLAVLSVAVALAAPLAASAEPDRAAFGEIVEVELVLVDVVAEDRNGNPVLDLGRDELRLFQDGAPVAIDQFTPPRSQPAGGDGVDSDETTGADTISGRKLVIFVDELHLHPNSRRRVFRDLEKLVDDHLAPSDEVMLATYAGRIEVPLAMTRDRRALRGALRDQAHSGAVSLLADNDTQRALETIAAARNLWAQSDRSGGAACRDVGHLAEAHARQAEGRVLGTIGALEQFVKTLAGFEGPKLLLHVSDGLPLVPGAEAYRYASELCDGTGAAKGVPDAIDTTTSTDLRNEYWDPTRTWATLDDLDTSDEWSRLAGHANTYQVSFYTYQARQPVSRSGTVTAVRTSIDVEIEGQRNLEDTLHLLADETGGVATLHSNDVATALATIDDDSRSGYQLAFLPPTPGDGRPHRLRLEVDRPGVTLRYRKSYRSKPLAERVSDRVLGVLMYGQEVNPLSARLDVEDAQRAAIEPSEVAVRVEVPIDELVLMPQGDRRGGLFTVFVAVRDARGQITPVGHKTLPIVAGPDAAPGQEYTYRVAVPVWGDHGQVAVAVRDEIGGEVSYLRREVRLAD